MRPSQTDAFLLTTSCHTATGATAPTAAPRTDELLSRSMPHSGNRRRVPTSALKAIAVTFASVTLWTTAAQTATAERGPSDDIVAPGTLCHGVAATKLGTAADDVLSGTPGDDVIVGLGGDDEIRGLGGNDLICAGGGDDVLIGGGGNDRLFGDGGRDWVAGDAGNDYLDIADGNGFELGDGGTGQNYCRWDPGDRWLNCIPGVP